MDGATPEYTITGYRQTASSDPIEFYEGVNKQGGIAWDKSIAGWIVTSFTLASHVLQNEEEFKPTDYDTSDGIPRVRGSGRRLETASGRDLHRLHAFMLRPLNPRACEEYRGSIVRPLVSTELDQIANARVGNLAAEYTEVLPMRIGCALLGLGNDANLIRRVSELQKTIRVWMDSLGDDLNIVRNAVDAFDEVRHLFMPTILDRRDNPREDVISWFWREGPSIFEDWNEEDTFISCWDHYFGGEIPSLLRNVIFSLLADKAMRERVLSAPNPYLKRYIEESVRIDGVVHWQVRIAQETTTLGDQEIHRGDRVFVMLAAANRDEGHFRCPHSKDLENEPPRDHLGFGRGPRYCAGRHLVRVEVYEAVLGLFTRFPNLRLDPRTPPPRLMGFHARSYSPIHVIIH